ncbi:hypothetical protein [Glaciecola sp. 1036]
MNTNGYAIPNGAKSITHQVSLEYIFDKSQGIRGVNTESYGNLSS